MLLKHLHKYTSLVLFITLVGCSSSNNNGSLSGANNAADETTAVYGENAKALAPTGWTWKPHSEGTGTLVVLAPGISQNTLSIKDSSGKAVGSVTRATVWEGRRSSYYFDKQGAAYPKPCFLEINGTPYKIANGADRIN